MSDKSSGGELGAMIGLAGLAVALITGVTQIPDARRFVCNEWSLLCDRTNAVRLFSVDFTNAGDIINYDLTTGDVGPFKTSEGWAALMALKKSTDLSRDCIKNPPTDDLPPAQGTSNEIIVGKNAWLFDSLTDKMQVRENRSLIFDLHTAYDYPLKRDVAVTVNVRVKQETLPLPAYAVSYKAVHPEGTQYFGMSCLLYYPVGGQAEFEFRIIDDLFHADDPIHKTIAIDAAAP